MLPKAFYLSSFLRGMAGTEQFRAYCSGRGIPSLTPRDGGTEWWPTAIASRPPEEQARIEWELAEVSELSGADGTAHLLSALGGEGLPPADVPAGAPLALWFLTHRPEIFREVLLHHDTREGSCWRRAQAALGIRIDDFVDTTAALIDALRTSCRRELGGGQFCTVEAERLPDGVCFVVRIADRPQLIEEFTDHGETTLRRIRPALTLFYLYTPRDGAVWLKSPHRAADSVNDLFRCFGEAVLGSPVSCGGPLFNLERLKHRFRPLPDGDDMEMVRVKALHLRYPDRRGRRQLTLDTLPGDEPGAVEEMLCDHVADSSDLRVSHAQLQVRLRVCGRIKDYLIRLWPDRYSFDRTPVGARLFQCLRQWGLCRA